MQTLSNSNINNNISNDDGNASDDIKNCGCGNNKVLAIFVARGGQTFFREVKKR